MSLNLRSWPGPRLASVPEQNELARLVDHVIHIWSDLFGARTASEAATCMGWRTKRRALAEGGSSIRSLLIPMLGGGFSIVVNDEHCPSDDEVEWLVAHEFAHSLFYTGREPPCRIVAHTPQEEVFCDRFADCVTAPLQPRPNHADEGPRPAIPGSASV